MIRDVEIARVGTYKLSTGDHTFTRQELAAAVRNADTGPAPRLAPGHIDPRFNGPEHDGTPALGKVTNLRLAADGDLLLGDYDDLPPWLEKRLGSAFPGRSIEASVKDGDMQIKAVKLLGLTLPGIKNLKDLQQHLSDEGPLQVAAGEDGDGRHIEIVIASTEEAAQQAGQLVGRTEAEPRPDTPNPKESTVDPKELRKEIGLAEDASDEDVKARLADLNGRPENTDDMIPVAEHETKVEEAVAAAEAKVREEIKASSGLPDGMVAVDKDTLDELKANDVKAAEFIAAAEKTEHARKRGDVITDALKGKVPPASKEKWEKRYDADPDGTTEILASMPRLLPTDGQEIGGSGGLDDINDDHDGGTGLFQFAGQEG